MVEYRARFRGTPSSVRLAREAVVDYARACGFEMPELADIALAAGEALANAVEHGSKDLGFIDVRCDFEADRLAIEIGDPGPGFDHGSVKTRDRDPSGTRGFGISIMHSIMDAVTYAGCGAVVVLHKRLGRATQKCEGECEQA